MFKRVDIEEGRAFSMCEFAFRKGVYFKSYFALLLVVGKATDAYLWRIPERVCVKKKGLI